MEMKSVRLLTDSPQEGCTCYGLTVLVPLLQSALYKLVGGLTEDKLRAKWLGPL